MVSIADHCHPGRDSCGLVMEYHQLPGCFLVHLHGSPHGQLHSTLISSQEVERNLDNLQHTFHTPSKIKECGTHLEFLRKF